MSIELCVKANRLVDLKDLIENVYLFFNEIHITEQPKIKVIQGSSEVTESRFSSFQIGKYPLEITVEISDYAKVFILVFSAGNSNSLGEDGGFWTYFDAGELPCPSIFLMISLAIVYANLTRAQIIDEASLLSKNRSISTEDAVSKLKISGEQNFISYSMKICQKLRIFAE